MLNMMILIKRDNDIDRIFGGITRDKLHIDCDRFSDVNNSKFTSNIG